MANQFNYELDDRQIKLTMLSATVPFDEKAWDKFKSQPISGSKQFATSNFPKMDINIGISRSIIMPVIFVILIGSLSALLFSFIDFKKKDTASTEIPLEIPVATKSVKKNEITTTPSLTVLKGDKNNVPEIKATESVKSVVTETIANNSIKKIEDKKVVEPVKEDKKEVIKTNDSKELKQKVIVVKKSNTIVETPKKKKKKKVITEEIPVITPKATILNTDPIVELEIDIK